MLRWTPLVVALALLAVPAAGAQATDGSETQTALDAGFSGLALSPGEADAVPLDVTYRYTPIPAQHPTPTLLDATAPSENVTVSPGTSTVFHPVEGPRDASTSRSHTVRTEVLVLAHEDAPASAVKVTVSGHSRENAPHAPSQGEAQFVVKVDEGADGASSTQSASFSPAAGFPVEALAATALAGLAVLAAARRGPDGAP